MYVFVLNLKRVFGHVKVSKLYALAPVLAPNVMPRGTTAEEEYKAFQTSEKRER